MCSVVTILQFLTVYTKKSSFYVEGEGGGMSQNYLF